MLQAYGKTEGQELAGLSTSEHSQVHWDDELMQSLSSLSSACDPLLILPHTFTRLPYFLPSVSYPPHSILSPSPTFFFLISLSLSPSYPPPSVSLLSPHHQLCIVAARKWERHSITVLIESLMARLWCVLLANRQQLTDSVPRNKSSAVCPNKTDTVWYGSHW